MMRIEEAEVTRFGAAQRHRTIGNPDTFMREIHLARRGLAGSFLGTRAGEKRAMKHGHLHLSGVIGYGDGEEAGILVVHVDEIDSLEGRKGREPQPLPVEQVLGFGHGNPRADGRKRRVSHHVALERFHERDARVFAAAAAVRPLLVVGLRLQCDAEPLDSTRIAGVIEANPRDADARIITRARRAGETDKARYQDRERQPDSIRPRPPVDYPVPAP